ncbi:MAG: hypothetical protein ACJ0GU_07800 [Gammaproteobacteria bacterium]
MIQKSMNRLFLLIFPIFTIFLDGCVTYSKNSSLPSIQDINLEEEFTIEGKFKINFNRNIETGYYRISTDNGLVSLTLGKNYLLPEENFQFNKGDKLKISDFLDINLTNENDLLDSDITVISFLDVILGYRKSYTGNFWSIEYPSKKSNINNSNIPLRTIISNKNLSLELLIQKIYSEK